MYDLSCIQGYPDAVLEQVNILIAGNKLRGYLDRRYSGSHEVQSDKALYQYTAALKQDYLRLAPPINKVHYDNTLDVIHSALGLHSAISHVHGGKLKARKEIRVASLFKDVPLNFLRMIVVHELAHFKEQEHNKAFFSFCVHMEPDYHQLEFDLRLFLIARDMGI